MEKTFEQVVKMLQEVAPEIWAAALRQVYVQIAQNIAWVVFLTICAYGFIYAMCYIYAPEHNVTWTEKEKDDNRCEYLAVRLVALVIWFICISGTFIGGILPRLMNPNWYAIEVLRSLLR